MVGSGVRFPRMRSTRIVLLGIALGTVSAGADAQRIAVSDSKTVESGPVRATQRVRVDFKNTPLRTAVRAIATQAGLDPSYDASVIPEHARVTLRATDVPVQEAFRHVLLGTGLEALIQVTGNVIIRATEQTQAQTGEITGTVRSAKTKASLSGATVVLSQTQKTVVSGTDGRFQFGDIAPGTYTLTVRMLGFTSRTRQIRVRADSITVADIVLESPSVTLDQVVVTATGEQRIRELGHTITRLNVDSLVKNAPITNVADLLTARVPGVQTLNGSGGMAGGDVAIRVRSQSTTQLDPQPIVIVDGVRFKSNNLIAGDQSASRDWAALYRDIRPGEVERRSPLHDLNINDVESVEVIKGPSASTLYGPDASNGVIVIRTKRGTSEKPQWRLYAYPRLNFLNGGIPNNGRGNAPQRGYWGWGHDPNTGEPVNFSCTLSRDYYGECVQDSVTSITLPAALPDLNVVAKNSPAWVYGGSVAGGSRAMRYFLSGKYDKQVGALRIPPAVKRYLNERIGESKVRELGDDPNQQQMYNSRINLDLLPNDRTTLFVSVGYNQTAQRAVDLSLAYGKLGDLGVQMPTCDPRTCADDMVRNNDFNFVPGNMLRGSSLESRRLTGDINGTMRVFPWLTTTGTMGLDVTGSTDQARMPSGTVRDNDQGSVQENQRDNIGRTMKFGLTTNHHINRWAFRTSLGAEYNYSRMKGIDVSGFGLPQGSTSIRYARFVGVYELFNELATLGSYGELQIGLNDRIFLTNGFRFDGSSAQGVAYQVRPDPKFGASWVVSEEPWFPRVRGLSEIRLRSGFGVAGRSPTSGMKLGMIDRYAGRFAGQYREIVDRATLANPLITPERSRESEWGADLTFLSGRITGEVTWWRRRTDDQIGLVPFPQGIPPQWANTGSIAGHGTEVRFNALVMQSQPVRMNVEFTYDFKSEKLVSLGAARGGGQRFHDSYRVGFPIGSIFGTPVIGVRDTVGGSADGLILYNEIVFDTLRFLGPIYPSRNYRVTPRFEFFNGRVHVSTSFDRSTGFVVYNNFSAQNASSDALLRPGAPIMEQAVLMAGGEFQPGDFTRWRELSIGTDLPRGLLRKVWLSQGSITLQVRNIALWQKYKGTDPESSTWAGHLASGGSTGAGLPAMRTWSISWNFVPKF